jgi:tetratricopeptide (TPR) repeat protein
MRVALVLLLRAVSLATAHPYLPAAVETSMPNLQELEQLEAYWHLRGHKKPALLIQEVIKEYEPFLWRIRPKVLALVQAFRKAGDADGAADAVRTTIHAQNHRDKFQESVELAQKELATARSSGKKGAAARLLLALAETASRGRGVKRADALEWVQEARATFKELKDPKLEGEALLALVNIYMMGAGAGGQKSMSQTALETAKDALELFQTAKYKRGQAAAIHAIAAARMNTKNVEGGLRTAKEALRLAKELGDKRSQVFELQSMATWCIEASQADKALPYAEEALRLVREANFGGVWEANAVNTVVQALCGTQEGSKAVKLASDISAGYKKTGNKQGEVIALDALVTAHLSLDDTAEALKAAEAAVALLRGLGNKQEEGLLMRLVSRLHAERQNYPEAVNAAKTSMKILKELGGKKVRASSLNAMAEVMTDSQQFDEAIRAASEERALYQKSKDQKGEALTLLVVAGLYTDSGSYEEAAKTAEIAEDLFGQVGDKFGEATALEMIAHVHMAANSYELALQAANHALPVVREVGDKRGEVGMLLLLAQATSLLLVASGGDPFSKIYKEAAGRAVGAASEAVALTRKTGEPALVGSGLCMLAQAHMVYAQGKDAVAAASEAVDVFHDLGDKSGEAYSLLMHANALLVSGKQDVARDEAKKGLVLFQELADGQGQALAENAIDTIEGTGQARQRPAGGRGSAPGAGEAGQIATIDDNLIKQKVRQSVVDIVGLEEISDDQPLMQTGLTSQSAVLLRNELTKAMPGGSLPFTMMFDYPSVNDLSDFFINRAQM